MRIFLTCFPTGGGSGRVHGSRRGGDVLGEALAEDGTGLASHLSSSVDFAKHDMGLTSEWKHDVYQGHSPDGFELVWIDEPETDERWQSAMVLNRALHEQSELEALTDARAEDTVDPVAGVVTE